MKTDLLTPIAVMGAGSWGTAFTKLLEKNGHQINLWGTNQEVIKDLRQSKSNQKYLPNVHFSDLVSPTINAATALTGVKLVALAIPMQRLRENLEIWSKLVPVDAVVLSLIKGIEHDTQLRASELISQYLPNTICVLSGPNLAAEIAADQLAAATVASDTEEDAILVQQVCASTNFKLFRSDDVVGVEIAGATKNIIALATGIVIGMGLGENAQAAILTRGLAEMAAIGVAVGAKRETFLGLAGIGDLIATSQSPHSRNRSFGVLLGQGDEISVAKSAVGQTVEAMHSTYPVLSLAKAKNLNVPIIEQVARILTGTVPAQTILEIFESELHDVEHY